MALSEARFVYYSFLSSAIFLSGRFFLGDNQDLTSECIFSVLPRTPTSYHYPGECELDERTYT